MKCKVVMLLAALCCVGSLGLDPVSGQETKGPPNGTQPVLSLVRAVMCEGTKDYAAQNPAVVFSVEIGRVLCFTSFDPVPEKTVIYHSWFFKDRLVTKIGLSLQPPRWSTFSSIQLREADKGPWHVVVSDEDGRVFDDLRFSITD